MRGEKSNRLRWLDNYLKKEGKERSQLMWDKRKHEGGRCKDRGRGRPEGGDDDTK